MLLSQGEEEGLKGKREEEKEKERERETVCRKCMQDAPYLSGTHGWISWSLNVCVCMHVYMCVWACMHKHACVCANQHLFSFRCSSMGISVPEQQSPHVLELDTRSCAYTHRRV